MDVSVIIVNYNTAALTRQCIASLFRHTSGLDMEVIVVDNGSTEDAAFLQQDFPQVRYIRSEENKGFAGGNNIGIAAATGKYILLLNSDTYLEMNALLPSFRFMEEHPDAGVLSARLVYPDGRHQSVAQRFPSMRYSLIELLRLQKLFSRRKAGRLLLGAFFDHKETTEADWVWGAYFMLPAAVLQQLPGHKLDDTYFMYWEDVQWCLDIRKLGYKVWFFAEAEVVHIHEGSNKGSKNEMMEQNGNLFLQRNYPAAAVKMIRWLQHLL
jgi:GT2 family glycosyltransferase